MGVGVNDGMRDTVKVGKEFDKVFDVKVSSEFEANMTRFYARGVIWPDVQRFDEHAGDQYGAAFH